MAYYYPEGYFGPICDAGIDDFTLSNLQRAAQEEVDDLVTVFDANITDDYTTPQGEPLLRFQKCKQRPDGTYYDCVYEWINPADAWDDFARCLDPYGVCYPWGDVSTKGLRLEEDFFVPDLDTESCSPFDSDINIREQQYFTGDGTLIRFGKIERSSPVTYPVTSGTESVVGESSITATFNGAGDLVIGGTGSGLVRLEFEWDDNPFTYGQALGTYTVAGRTFTQTVNVESGSDGDYVEVNVGTYPATIFGGSGYDGFRVDNNNKRICFYDLDGDDCNAKIEIKDVVSTTTVSNTDGYWSDLGNAYGVWVNAEECTLPLQEQEVTYIVPIAATDTYTFQFGCDDVAQLFLNDETQPVLDIQGGIFAGGALSTPYTYSRTLNGGTNLKMVVRCTNSDAGFQDGNGEPTGLAYSWQRNPGGWFIRICRGGECFGPGNDINWVHSPPWYTWSELLNTYGVWPSNTSPLPDTVHTATWNVVIPVTGNYTLSVSQDDQSEYFLDGVSLGTRTGWAEGSVSSFTLSNLTSGIHTIGVAALNVVNSAGLNADWASNPGGVAWKLTDQSNTIISTSRDLQTSGDGNIIWTTRDAIGYEYYEITQN